MKIRALRKSALALLVVAIVAGCSSETEKQPTLGTVALGMAKAKLRKGKVEKADKVAASAPQQIPREALAKYGKPVIYISVPRFGSNLPAIEVATNGPYRTYLGGDKASVTLRDGIVTATRGQLVDLIAQDLSLSPKQIFYGGSFPKLYTRTQRHLNGEGKLTTHVYNCAIAPAEADEVLDVLGRKTSVRQYSELCKNAERAFQNSYWIERGAQRIWKSHQSISKEVGHLIVKVAIP